ncbi:MAG: hypothetical protein NTX25_15750 [Proteobacteria bacterium]|nr:hypothetical protein [Pseudomonadota bacterium]
MQPLSGSWRPLEEKQFAEGSLLRLAHDSSIELKLMGSELSQEEASSRIRISQALIFRIDRQLFKKVQFDDYVLNGIWGEGSKEEKEITTFPLLSFSAAFVRYFLSLETEQNLPKLKVDPTKQTIEAGEEISNLEVLSPSQDSFQELDRPRISVPVIWQSPSDDLSYKIFLWPSTDVKREALATVKADHYLLTLDHPGSYRLQISSTDHRYRSPVIRIDADRPLAYKRPSEPLDEIYKKDLVQVDPNLSITYPPPHFELNSPNYKPELLVSWHDKDGLEAGELYTVVILAENFKQRREIQVTENFARFSLSEGRYRYFIKKNRPTLIKSARVSLSQDIQIIHRKLAESWSIAWLLSQKVSFDRTVLIEHR